MIFILIIYTHIHIYTNIHKYISIYINIYQYIQYYLLSSILFYIVLSLSFYIIIILIYFCLNIIPIQYPYQINPIPIRIVLHLNQYHIYHILIMLITHNITYPMIYHYLYLIVLAFISTIHALIYHLYLYQID